MRAMSLTLSLALAALVTAGCRTVKTSESTRTRVGHTAVSRTMAKSEVHSNFVDNSQLVAGAAGRDTACEVITEVELSAPDSRGRQHVLRAKTTERNVGKRRVAHVVDRNGISWRADSAGVAIGKSRASASAETDAERLETVRKRTPSWVWLPVGIVSLGLVVLAYLVLKRFGLVR